MEIIYAHPWWTCIFLMLMGPIIRINLGRNE